MSYRIGVDIGGTFTDFALIDDVRGSLTIHKQLTTPDDPARAVLEGMATILEKASVSPGDVSALIHGSTLVTNAVIERRGARTGMLVTAGFRDVLDIANERRYDLYDLRSEYPPAVVPQQWRAEISERLRDDGEVVTPLDIDEVVAKAEALVREQGIEALAICFLHSCTNAAHEDAAREAISRALPKLYISTSAEVFPFIREYERWNTTALNAYTQPMVDRYLANLEAGLAKSGMTGAFYVMTSSGGVVGTDIARRFPVRMLESGPAAGVLMSAFHGQRIGAADLLSFDMGGTTAKGAIIAGGKPHKVYELEVARVHGFKQGSGLPVKIPVLDMIEIGAGGGGIADIDDRGLIRVGPRSAGAMPGPACYGRGGQEPTLTDANLSLGYYDADFFLGGTMALDSQAAAKAIGRKIGEPLDLELARAAWGIHEIINEDVARAFRVHASEIGFDYRRCSMIAFGGSGPAHALRIARKLRIPEVVFPPGAGVMSAIGMLVCPMSFQVARSNRVAVDELQGPAFVSAWERLDTEASALLKTSGVAADDIRLSRALDMRYTGQGFEIEVKLPDGVPLAEVFADLPRLYSEAYKEVFSLSYLDQPIEIVAWKVEAIGPEPANSGRLSLSTGGVEKSLKGSRRAYVGEVGDYVECPVYDRYALCHGEVVEGPAFIEEREATIVVGKGDRISLDSHGNLIAQLSIGDQL